MGFELNRFVDRIEGDSIYLCSVCKKVLKDPVMIEDDICCRECVPSWLGQHGQAANNQPQLLSIPRTVANNYGSLKIYCDFAQVRNIFPFTII